MQVTFEMVCSKCGYRPKDKRDALIHALSSHMDHISSIYAAMPDLMLDMPKAERKDKEPAKAAKPRGRPRRDDYEEPEEEDELEEDEEELDDLSL